MADREIEQLIQEAFNDDGLDEHGRAARAAGRMSTDEFERWKAAEISRGERAIAQQDADRQAENDEIDRRNNVRRW